MNVTIFILCPNIIPNVYIMSKDLPVICRKQILRKSSPANCSQCSFAVNVPLFTAVSLLLCSAAFLPLDGSQNQCND